MAHRPAPARPRGKPGATVSLPPSLPRSHMEPGFFQHGGKGNRHVWLGRAAPHPLSSWIPRSRSPSTPSPLLTVPSARPLCPAAEPGLPKATPRAELLRRFLIRLPPAPKLAALSAVCLEPAAASRLGVLDASSSAPWASIAGGQPPRQPRPRQPGGGSQGLAPSTNLPALSRRWQSLHSFLLRLWLLRFPHSPAWPLSCDGVQVYCRVNVRNFGPRRLVRLLLYYHHHHHHHYCCNNHLD